MGRKLRVWHPHKFYHIVCRGNRRDPLFRSDHDFQAMFYILQEVHNKIPFELTAFCFMTNHFHLQMRSQIQPISKVMSFINKWYANYYNARFDLTGHVFEKRFYDTLIEDPIGMLEVSRYIHLNPLEAQMVKEPKDYPWSSMKYYDQDIVSPPVYLNTTILHSFFSGTEREKRERYVQFLTEKKKRIDKPCILEGVTPSGTYQS